jgi:hypothetical protein
MTSPKIISNRIINAGVTITCGRETFIRAKDASIKQLQMDITNKI